MASYAPIRVALRRARVRAEAGLASAARAVGYELRRQHYYLPFPDVEALPDALWTAARPLPGVDLRLEPAVALLRDLAAFVPEFDTAGFPIANGSYEHGDAETLYAMLRLLKPKRLIELGSGASSHLISVARRANFRVGQPFEFESYDPFPGWHELGPAEGAITHPVATQALDPSVLDALQDGDVLFVDTTHTVKTGGDVTRIVLELLPRLKPGVHVHIHDIFLPFEYPREWVVDGRRAWAEQYLLQAFLAFNPTFEVELPVHALFRLRTAESQDAIPALKGDVGTGPGAFWIRRV